MSQSNDVREILNRNIRKPMGVAIDADKAEEELLSLLEQSNREARDNAIRLVLDNYDEWMKPENRQYGTVLENFIKRVDELQHPEGRE